MNTSISRNYAWESRYFQIILTDEWSMIPKYMPFFLLHYMSIMSLKFDILVMPRLRYFLC